MSDQDQTLTPNETNQPSAVEPPEREPTASAEPSATEAAEIAELRQRLARAEAEAAEHKDQWLRATADYKNFKRRTEAERAELVRSAASGLLLKLLPVVDDFDRAIANIPEEIANSSWWGGTQLIASKLRTLLESEGVKTIEAVGQEFDPNFHEAVLYEEAEGMDGKVVAELQKGYILRDRVLRASMVKVGRG